MIHRGFQTESRDELSVKDIVVLGAGGLAKEVAFLIDEINRTSTEPEWNILGFIDSDLTKKDSYNGKYRIIGDEDYLVDFGKTIHAVIGIGVPALITKIHKKLCQYEHIRFPSLIHPSVIMDFGRVHLGEGNIICAGNTFTTDISIGSCNVFNPNCTYGHDSVIGNYCVFMPGLNISGGVQVGDGCLIGAGATVLQYLAVGAGATVGAGAVVTKDVEPGMTLAGVPAKPLIRG
jgi:sugar O-acyltransferase (sialic acid O-acetyltransferase NeuD family)